MKQPVVRGHRDLIVWQKGMRLFVDTSRLIRTLPYPERYDIGRQMRRSALSIPCNIAEGSGRDHLGDFLLKLSTARGEVAELDTQLLCLRAVSLASKSRIRPLLALADEISRMLTGLSQSLRSRQDLRRRS